MANEIIKTDVEVIQKKILTFRSQQVMIDRDLAELYGVETKVLNQAVKRNIERFPENFMFQLDENEKRELVTNCDRFNILKHSSVAPYAFTEQGVTMLSAVLRSDTAVQVSIQIMNAFVAMRHFLASHAQIFTEIDAIKRHQFESDKKIDRKILYHIGASLKDLGKKCFAFETLDASLIPAILGNV